MKTGRRTKRKSNDDSDYSQSDFEEEMEEYRESSCDEEEISEISEMLGELNPKKRKKQAKKKPLKDTSPEKDIKLLKRKRITDTPLDNPNPKSKKTDQVIQLNQPPHVFDLSKDYFYQNVTNSEWQSISQFIEEILSSPINPSNSIKIKDFFAQHPKLSKGQHNLTKVIQIINDKSKAHPSCLFQYQQLTGYILSSYYIAKPTVFDVYFFPNEANEIYVINMLKTCKESMDIAIFTMTNSRIANAIEETYRRNVKLRIIADDECCKMWGSHIHYLASIGINVKTDDSVRYHMHHKFAVIDKAVVLTGSFNWTTQAVKNNQENILFIENKELAMKYSNEFQRLWDDFETVVSQETASRIIKEQDDKKKALENRRKKEKELKQQKKMEEKEKERDKSQPRITKPIKAKQENKENTNGNTTNNASAIAKSIAKKIKSANNPDGANTSCFIF